MVYVRKDEIEYLQQNGLGRFILGKTCHGKKFIEEDRRVLLALKKYNASIVMEANYGTC